MIISMQTVLDINSESEPEFRILQSDYTRGTPGHTQPKVVLSDATSS